MRLIPCRWPALCALFATHACVPAHSRRSDSELLSTVVSATPLLVVVLHGDAPFNKPSYQDAFGARVAAAYPDVVVAAILAEVAPLLQ